MKLLITADWHIDRYTAGLRRLPDLHRAALETVRYAIENEVDNYIHLGDMMNADSGSCVFECLEVWLHLAALLAESGVQSHWLSGNHDVIEDGTGHTTLSPLHAFSRMFKSVHVHTNHGFSDMYLRDGRTPPERVMLLTLPFVPSMRAYDPLEVVQRCLCKAVAGMTVVIAGHMTDIPGILPGSETKDMARGRGIRFPREEAIALAKEHNIKLLMFNGHFHERQCFKGIHIPGSLERLTFGESHHQPGFILAEV